MNSYKGQKVGSEVVERYEVIFKPDREKLTHRRELVDCGVKLDSNDVTKILFDAFRKKYPNCILVEITKLKIN